MAGTKERIGLDEEDTDAVFGKLIEEAKKEKVSDAQQPLPQIDPDEEGGDD
jgi:hypothetical protein